MSAPSPTSIAAIAAVLSPKSRWNAGVVHAFARDSQLPLRVSSLGAHGFPNVTSLWFRLEAGRFLCCTQRGAVLARDVARDGRVGFELAVNEPPYYGIRGQAEARLLDDDPAPLLAALAEHYLEGRDRALREWLLSRTATEVVVALTPHRITSWDFRGRMSAPG
ncbi:MAG: pyridoxamine 5'-phosphate oxidase family protein [Gammaproteobacteria bacterium]|nr:pyridoxamine 5'-phosphate oxidase family protein [Gammaproteobacteria bacterium]